MTQTLSLAKNSFQKIADNHPLWNHEFLMHCRSGNLFLPDVQMLAVQMYKFSKEFNRILASILSCCQDESTQLVILENLFDEMGQGDVTKSHPELFRQFTRALGIHDETLAALPTAPETRALIDTYLQIPHKYGYLAALGAVCYASEGIVSSLYAQLYKGIVGAAPLPKESLIFFEVHINIDDSHAAKLAAVIEAQLGMIEDDIKIKQAIVEAMDARFEFFNGIQQQISQYSLSPGSILLISA
ncbi:TenA family transcriptional regulator [Nostoc sp. 2RC]|uniref:TenA family transcriptional regulator n=1 Tax=Nostoc sp. 2RC TaxID=2485484 RepID=UPI001626C83A|nr:iron-containing redox enzyme family protein [Nostoc sp. 2RC]MBC1240415.1 iron-containing redox enzyme family protein [Nostoc sp. 2RC]